MITLELLVEELSAEYALRNLLPRIITRGTAAYNIRSFQGKSDLIKKLPVRLKGYKSQPNPGLRIMVLLDEDRQDCFSLKDQLEKIAARANFTTKSAARAGTSYQLVNRIAVEELEAWFFGDTEALIAAYPDLIRHFPKLRTRREFTSPDEILNGTWETLEKLLQKAGYYPGGLPKTEAAKRISNFMQPARNKSKSFQLFRQAVLEIVEGVS